MRWSEKARRNQESLRAAGSQGIDHDQVEQKLSHPRCVASMVGVILGEVSGGVVAIDHDGDGADEVLREVFGLEQLPETAMITSGGLVGSARSTRCRNLNGPTCGRWSGIRASKANSSRSAGVTPGRWPHASRRGNPPQRQHLPMAESPERGHCGAAPADPQGLRNRLEGEKRQASPHGGGHSLRSATTSSTRRS